MSHSTILQIAKAVLLSVLVWLAHITHVFAEERVTDTSPRPPFSGVVGLHVNATDTRHQIFLVEETIPVQRSGDMVLLYPQWETASHAPTAAIADLASLRMTIDGRPTAWRRDPLNPYAFHINVPNKAKVIQVAFTFLGPVRPRLIRSQLVVVPWHRTMLYPAGFDVRNVPVSASLTLSNTLTPYAAMPFKTTGSGKLTFATTSLNALIDSPVYAGLYTKRYSLNDGTGAPVFMDLFADASTLKSPSTRQIEQLKTLVTQTLKSFGPAPFAHYDAIVTLSDVLAPGGSAGGTEHLEEGENNLPAAYFADDQAQINNADLIAHELVHAWNGVARTPQELHSGDYNSPVSGSLLWVYEGQTEFWGRILAERAGLRSRQQTLDKLADDAAAVANRSGRRWKDLQDSTNDAVYMAKHRIEWRDWQRREDYYPEGVLLWLDVDARLRELTGGARGLDEFARQFFAADLAQRQPTYTFDDVCRGLDQVVPSDWAAFLNTHLHTHESSDVTAGLARSGWRLVYTANPSQAFQQEEQEMGLSNFDYSLGMQVSSTGEVDSVMWQGPSFRAGVATGDTIETVNGAPFTSEALRSAVAASPRTPVVLRIRSYASVDTVTIDYRGGLRYPHLERVPSAPDRLTDLLKAR